MQGTHHVIDQYCCFPHVVPWDWQEDDHTQEYASPTGGGDETSYKSDDADDDSGISTQDENSPGFQAKVGRVAASQRKTRQQVCCVKNLHHSWYSINKCIGNGFWPAQL